MKYMSGNELREAYLQFFSEKKGHLRLPSFSLIPKDDPTLLLIGAGMAPLKPFFTGKMKPPRTRVTTSQRCVRTGDIENVGRTARHQTYFEMLGNFSFGDYFKGEAIPWAWEFLTEVIELPKDKLWVTVYPDDEEAIAIWKAQPGFPQDHIVKLDDNFWEIGPGPCGPDSEIYIDLGEERGCGSPDCAVGCDCDRYLEIWNLVFTQYDRQEDGSYKNLAHKNIDTGCGLERLASVVQNKKTNFETDLLYPIIEYAAKTAGVTYGKDETTDISLKVIADHARSMAIMIMDGILPSNEGRGYVLRRILRRAVRHGRMLGITNKFLEGAVDAVVDIYRDARDFEELVQKAEYIKKVISIEEDRFAATLNQGIELLNGEIQTVKAAGKTELDGKIGFRLYDTFGFPWELTEEILHEHGLDLDKAGFDQAMEEQRTRARNARAENTRVAVPDLSSIDVSKLTVDPEAHEGKVVAIWKDGRLVDEIHDGEEAGIILDKTPFYAEGGGQVGDEGLLISELGRIKAVNAKKLPDGTVYHVAYVEEGQLKVGETVRIEIDQVKKLASARNHTATHLLQAALKRVVGDQVNQAGSSVTPERLRFDFTNFEPVTPQQLADVEALVNEKILQGIDVEISQMSLEEAKAAGAMALFSEKYGDVVRVVKVPGFSMELCAGSHVKNVGQIGMFKIVSESGIASGVRRIEAITGKAALDFVQEKMGLLSQAASALKTSEEEVPSAISRLQSSAKEMESKLAQVASMQEKADAQQLVAGVQEIQGIHVIAGKANVHGMDALRELADMVIGKIESGVVVLGCVSDGKVNLVVKASKDVVKKGIHSGKIIKEAAAVVGGGGGGRPDMAQAGGKNAEDLPKAFDKAVEIIKAQIG
ncbi:alanine--tRNA ligase [Selenomonas sp. WCA-380-WT-3B 3/]|uniref:Alanine--tRNA ligase n=2 Tax=Selenomonas montiformis TaxID=2652285 RepID=A0A6I2UQ59_9FIRM|nr:alanine--tRNA ligase [Selenomonas montiformis]